MTECGGNTVAIKTAYGKMLGAIKPLQQAVYSCKIFPMSRWLELLEAIPLKKFFYNLHVLCNVGEKDVALMRRAILHAYRSVVAGDVDADKRFEVSDDRIMTKAGKPSIEYRLSAARLSFLPRFLAQASDFTFAVLNHGAGS